MLYKRYLQKLHRGGRLNEAQTPLERAGTDAHQRDMAQVYGAARYGSHVPDDAQLHRVQDARR